MMNVGTTAVTEAQRIKKASPKVFEEVKAGKTTLSEAKRKIAEPEPGPIPGPEPETENIELQEVDLTLSLDPVVAAITIRRHFQGERLRHLIDELGK